MQVLQPLVAQAQTGKGCAGQGIEAAPAHHAAIALQAAGLSATVGTLASAMGTWRPSGSFLDQAMALAWLLDAGQKTLQQRDLIFRKRLPHQRFDQYSNLRRAHAAS
ncbi:hypothetical protein OU994_12455 [Pseudoduganella sp. SL102]|nr:hypothetical protein [Pseudoduganella sp. SL102]WBS05025.1 hypothetical protein OU994_12455 [Pseudoduganella sp. SL102]